MAKAKATDYRAAFRRQRDEMRESDLRRQKQISNQVASIERLLDDPTATREIAELHTRLAVAEAQRDRAVEALEEIVKGMDDAIAERAASV